MKKLLTYILILTIAAFSYFILDRQSGSQPLSLSSPLPSPNPYVLDKLDSITFNNQTYHYALVTINNLDQLTLLPNYPSPLSSLDLITTHKCNILINAGFYDHQNQPLGWLVSEGQTLSPAINSSLFNGFLYSYLQKPSITSALPQTPVDLGLQSGPLLIENSQPLFLNIKNDQSRRRVIAALNNDNLLVFIALVGSDSVYSGPLLADTPAILAYLSQELQLQLLSAINLDGGSASTLYTPDLHLKEYNPIGSFFCLN